MKKAMVLAILLGMVLSVPAPAAADSKEVKIGILLPLTGSSAEMGKLSKNGIELAERKHQMAGTLSGGEQQMCAVARGLMAKPKILMLDEPSLGLAPIMVETIFEAIVKINKLGTCILLVEQNVLYALEIANRGYVIETGETVLQGTSQELRSNEKLRKAYLGL